MKFCFFSDENVLVLEFLSDKIGGVSLGSFKKLLKEREIRVNGTRISQNIAISAGDKVEVFVPASFVRAKVEVVFEDENILVVDKPTQTTVTGGLVQMLQERYPFVVPVHRLDRNTRGLVVLAKSPKVEEILLSAFKERELEKKYRALVCGQPQNAIYKAYIFKDAKNSISYVSDINKVGYKQILTGCRLIKDYQGRISEVELSLLTGRTHQLRAHMAFLGHPIIGDDKYGNHLQNKLAGTSVQQLIATSIEFPALPSPLNNLEGKKITLDANFDPRIIQNLVGTL